MRGASGLLLSVLVAGCSSADLLRWAPPPPADASTQSLLISVTSDSSTQLRALSFQNGQLAQPLQWAIDEQSAQSSLRLRAYGYEARLPTLGLQPGEVGRRPGRPCSLEQPAAAYELDLMAEAPTWAEVPLTLDAATVALLFGDAACAKDNRCREFESRRVPLGSGEDIFSMVALDDRRVLFADLAGLFYEAEGTTVRRRPDLDGLPAFSIASAGRAGLWFGGRSARAMRGPPGGPYERWTVGTSTQATIAQIAQSPTGRETLALLYGPDPDTPSATRVSYHVFAEAEWRKVADGPLQEVKAWESDIVWVSDRDAVVTHGANIIAHYDGSAVHTLDVNANQLFDQNAGALWPAGPDAVYSGGRIGLLTRISIPFDSVEELAYPIPNTVQSMHAYNGGLMISGTNGFVGQWYPDADSCDGPQYHFDDALTLLPVGGHVYVGGTMRDRSQMNELTILTPL